MAIRTLDEQHIEQLPSVEEIMMRYGIDRDAADLYLAVKSGWALTNDRVFVPEDQRDAVLRELEEAAAACLAAAEEAAKNIEPAASVEENMARSGLDRNAVEAYLRYLRGESLAGEPTTE